MSRRMLLVRAGAGTALFAAIAAACGSDDASEAESTVGVTTPAPTTTVAAAPETAAPSDSTVPASPDTSAPPADSAEWDAVVTAAKSEGHVVLYSSIPTIWSDRLEVAFEAEYPEIDLEIVRVVSSADMDAALDTERATGQWKADVVNHINYTWARKALADGLLTEPVGPNVTGPEWMGTDNLIGDRLLVSAKPALVIGWNTSLLSEAPSNYDDLLTERFAGGLVGIPDANLAIFADFYAFLEDNFGGESYLAGLAAQQPRFYPSAVPLEQAVVAGEVAAGIFTTAAGMIAAKEQGGPVDITVPDPAWAAVILGYMLDGSSNPNAAQVLLDFMSSRAGQEALTLNSVSVLDDIPGNLDAGEVVALNLDRVNTPGFAEDYFARFSDIFGR